MSFGRNSGWQIKFDDGFADDLRQIGKSSQLRIKKYIDKLQAECSDPRDRGEPLRANLTGFWKYRVGDYRLLCQIMDGELVILCLLMVSHRSRSYSDMNTDKLLKRALELLDKLR